MRDRFDIRCRRMPPGVAFDGRRFRQVRKRWLCIVHDRATGEVGWAVTPGGRRTAVQVSRDWADAQSLAKPLRGPQRNPYEPDWRGMVNLSRAEGFIPELLGAGPEIPKSEITRIRKRLAKVERATKQAKSQRRKPEVAQGAINDTRKALDKYESMVEASKNKSAGLGLMRKQWRSEVKRRGRLVEAQREIEELRDAGALFAVSHSGGKDSQAMLIRIRALVPDEQIVVVHAPLLGVEWTGIIDQVERYLPPALKPVLLAPAVDKDGNEKWLLEWVLRRHYWPDSARRWCTAEFKRGPIRKVVRKYADTHGFTTIVDAVGLRAEESTTRLGKPVLEELEDEHGKRPKGAEKGVTRGWYKWHPIKWLSTEEIFGTIEDAGEEPIWTYAEGMQRASCAFCVLASNDDLKVAARLAPDLYASYVAVEEIVDDYWRDTEPRQAEYKKAMRVYDRELKKYEAGERGKPGKPRTPPPCHTMKGSCRRLEEVIGIKADRTRVNKVKRQIQRTGELREITHAGEPPKKWRRRLPVVTAARLTPQRGFGF